MLQDATTRWRGSKATKQTRIRRCKTFKCCKMLLGDEGDETRPPGCKYPRRPCAPSFVKSRTLRPLQTHFLLFQQTFFVLVCMHSGTPRVPPRVLASGPKSCGGNNLITSTVRSLRENLKPRLRSRRIDLAIARSIRQGLSLRFSRNDFTLGY